MAQEEVDKKMNGLKLAHQTELKEIKILSQKFTCDFFKDKASDLQNKLTDESNKIYDHFDETRT